VSARNIHEADARQCARRGQKRKQRILNRRHYKQIEKTEVAKVVVCASAGDQLGASETVRGGESHEVRRLGEGDSEPVNFHSVLSVRPLSGGVGAEGL
jgi:hypothetical protein